MTTSRESGTEPLRSFLYVDSYKLNSISAQLFSGITNFVIQEARESTKETEAQKAPFGSGRLLGDEALRESTRQEHRVIHDFAYTRLENELRLRGALKEIGVGQGLAAEGLSAETFVKVTGQASFMDLQAISHFMSEFNQFGEAIARVTTMGEREELKKQVAEATAAISDRNRKSELKEKLKQVSSIAALAKGRGLWFDPDSLKSLAYLLAHGFGDHFELQVRPSEDPRTAFFSALLKREYLRESEGLIVKKYGREAQSHFSIVGIVAQCGKTQRPSEDAEITHMRDAIRNMAMHLCAVEETFFGTFANEIVIDPIAVYRTL